MTLHPLNPFALFVAGWDWRATSSRRIYWAAILWFVTPILIIAGLYASHPWQSPMRVACFVLIAFLNFAAIGHTVRRVRDIGWHGAWALITVVPVVGLIASVVFGIKTSGAPRPPGRLLGVGYGAGLALSALLLLRAIWFEPFWIPSGSMKPNLRVGDYVITQRTQDVEPGDVIVFRHPRFDTAFVKRLIAVGGDVIEFDGQQPIVNGVAWAHDPLPDFIEPYEFDHPVNGTLPICATPVQPGADCIKSQWTETQPNGNAYPVLTAFDAARSQWPQRFEVPAGHVFVMGDNRDNSNDSRVPGRYGVGMVPVDNVEFRVLFVLINFLTFDRLLKGV